jgi:hypothetical protein
MDKGGCYFTSKLGRHVTSSHNEKVHVVVLNALVRRVQVVAQTRAYTGMLVGHHACSNRPGADQHAAFDASCVDSRRKFTRYALVIAPGAIPRRNIINGVALSS